MSVESDQGYSDDQTVFPQTFVKHFNETHKKNGTSILIIENSRLYKTRPR